MKPHYIISFLLLCLGTATPLRAQSNADSADIYFHHLDLDEVVVSSPVGQIKRKQSATPISVVSERTLHQTSSTNIIDAVAKQPGVAQVTTGSGISKPVIRGLGYNRIVTVADGVRQEGQQWGDEHGIELDGQSVGQVEILKGPASLMYGSDAMAGVVIFHPESVEPDGRIAADVSTEYQTNSGLFDYSLRLGGNNSGFVWNGRYSEKLAHAYKNKYDGYVPGTQFHERAANVLLGLNKEWGFSHLTLGYYHINPSMTEGERDAVTGELLSSVSNLKTYHKTLPYQQIRHYKAVLDNSFVLGDGLFKAVIGYQQNRRQEFEGEHHHHHDADEEATEEDHDADAEAAEEDHDHEAEAADEDHDHEHTHAGAGLDFLLHTLTYDLHYVYNGLAGWKLTGGLGGMYQRSSNEGEEYLIPAYNLFDIGAYVTGAKTIGQWSLSGGLRFDNRHLHSHELLEEGALRFSDFSRNFSALTGSVGAVYHVHPDVNIRANVARGFRAPNLSELGSNGIHHGTLRYEIGNKGLNPEYSWQTDLGADYSGRYLSVEAAFFLNRIDNYIFAACTSSEAEVASNGYRTYHYTQGDALLKGFEAGVDIHPIHQLHIGSTFSMVDARQLHQSADTRYLPLTPPARLTGEVKWEFSHNGDHHAPMPAGKRHNSLAHIFDNAFVSAGVAHYFRQNHYYKAYGTETATPAYTLFNITAGTDILLPSGYRLCELYLIADNLFDCAYQSHLSRLKYADINSQTGRMGIYNPGRNITLKLIFPLKLT
ncbi:MAG: TonB-dependent receptor [Bacteroidales bacterium]|nr:TonB-dependent receptor [Bacteroidales bacterium]